MIAEQVKVNIPPARKPLMMLVNRVVLFVLGRGLQSASKHDPAIRAELARWQPGFTFMLKQLPHGPSMAVTRTEKGDLRYQGANFPEEKCDVIFFFRNVESAFMMFTAQIGTPTAYAQHRMSARGDLANSMAMVRVLNSIQAYLFPAFIARGIMKRLPPIPFWYKQALRLKIYLLGIPFGI